MDPSSAPLADYFWIAGIDSLTYDDPVALVTTNGRDRSQNGAATSPPIADTTIEEGIEGDGESEAAAPRESRQGARHSRNNSWQRFSRQPNDERLSITSMETLQKTNSNRSSITIRAVPVSLTSDAETPNGIDSFDFDRALVKFANDREHFLDDLSFSAGAVPQNQPPMTNRAEMLKIEETGDASGRRSPFGKVGGSIRRRLSFRDMSSMKRQPTVSRSASVRTSKRLSNYNSVIPPPEPLNADPDMHPLKRRFEPALLDRYPPKDATDELKRRGKFPDYVPMFAFPNDINIVSSDERPRSTWHGFVMTSEDNSKIYGITVIVWIPVNEDTAADVEKRCEAWRQSHMSNEERELASSLGERLAHERATLSRLLAKLPTATSGSQAREALEEQISAVEEKIGLMADMLRPVRHAAAAKIDGLTDGATGLWIPRAYGILGRDPGHTSFWKEWLRAIVVPMTDGGILRIPPSSPKVGRWQPLERYVVNLCTEALSPITSKTQVEIAVRELRIFARKEGINEIPDSRNCDLYAIFRSLSLANIMSLFEFVLSESRIILLSSHTAMLHLASKAITSLLYPMKWASIFIPVLPARLISALEAPCPYIVGIERRYDNIELPDDDFVLVDLDYNTIEATSAPFALPRHIRRKLMSLLLLAAPHQNRFGVPIGPPPYAIEAFPYNAYSSENGDLFTQNPRSATLSKWVNQNSTTYGEVEPSVKGQTCVFNAFLQSKNDHTRVERPSTSKSRQSPPPSVSPISGSFQNQIPTPTTPISRNDSGFALTATLREKRSGHFDSTSRRSSSFGTDRGAPALRNPNVPFAGHQSSLSTSAFSVDTKSTYGYAPSTYAASTLAASTIMPNMLMQNVHNTNSMIWVEGHCMEWYRHDTVSLCSICDERAENDGVYKCRGCSVVTHGRCLGQLSLVCPSAFHEDRIRAAFVRCFASLFYTYRKHLKAPNKEQKACGQFYGFDIDGFMKSVPADQTAYIAMLKQTQAFNEFIHERETTRPTIHTIRLFDEIILAKKNRGFSRGSFFAKSSTSFLDDTSDYLWRSAAVPVPTGKVVGDYRSVICRVPSKLDVTLMREPRAIGGVPRMEKGIRPVGRKAVPSMLGLGALKK